MTARVTQDGRVVPIGVGNDGTCGDGEFELITGPVAGASGDRTRDDRSSNP